jgi:hypothetical protein
MQGFGKRGWVVFSEQWELVEGVKQGRNWWCDFCFKKIPSGCCVECHL